MKRGEVGSDGNITMTIASLIAATVIQISALAALKHTAYEMETKMRDF